MRAAILTDIHANREALDAVLSAVEQCAPDLTVLLGDIVGYGPDPVYCVEKAAELAGRGAVCLLGNHDEAALAGPRGMTENARTAIEWTRRQLQPAHLDVLRALPLTVVLGDVLFVHASAERPERWIYIDSPEAAAGCLAASPHRLVLCGHTHVPAIFYALPGRGPTAFRPLPNKPAPLTALGRQVVVVGSVGQPRDGNPAACFALLDTDDESVTMMRVPYDAVETHRKIVAAGLPGWLGMRLLVGR